MSEAEDVQDDVVDESQEQETAQEDAVIDVDALMEERSVHQESLASETGWKPLEEYVKNGGDPKQWVTAAEYNMKGEFIEKSKRWEQGYQNKADKLEKLYKAQTETRVKELEDKLKAATQADIPDADQILGISEEIREAKSEVQTESAPQTQGDPVLAAWNAKNTWITDTEDVKAAYAIQQWNIIAPRATSTEAGLAQLEAKLATKFPESKHVPASGERGKNRGFTQNSGKLTLSWDDLKPSEVATYEMSRSGWKSQDDYLKAVALDRKQQAKKG